MSDRVMKDEAARHLRSVILPFWKALADTRHGGFYGETDDSLKTDKQADKGVLLHARILWFFSNAYSVAGDADSLGYAARAFEFIERAVDREFGGVYWSMTYDGLPAETLKHTYNQAFAVYALSAYHAASKDPGALRLARDIFSLIETKCKAAEGYNESFDRSFRPCGNEKLADNETVNASGAAVTKTMNTILHLAEAYTALYQVTGDTAVKSALEGVLELIESRIYDRENKRLSVFFDDHYRSLADVHSYGHDIEAAWLIDLACGAIGYARSAQMSAFNTQVADNILDAAFDGRALYNERTGGCVDRNRVWWVQAEAVVGFINEYQKSGHEKYLAAARAVFGYIMEHIADKRGGSEWFWEVDENDRPVSGHPIAGQWKCPYHNGRMVFELMKREIICVHTRS
ncbi:MAG: AGE family epimerase/isomerase [Oscillospiraceae bacterium]|nr:AGE family epimerase/isomerase [Oscillospiraceae bacterium]